MPLEVNLNNLVVLTVTVQFVMFGWRILREIAEGDKDTTASPPDKGTSKTSPPVWRMWLPWPDRVNLASLCLVTVSCIVVPIVTGRFSAFSRAALVAAVILWVCHPISTACHYELFRGGRQVVYGGPDKWPLVTPSERNVVVLSVILAALSGFVTWQFLAR